MSSIGDFDKRVKGLSEFGVLLELLILDDDFNYFHKDFTEQLIWFNKIDGDDITNVVSFLSLKKIEKLKNIKEIINNKKKKIKNIKNKNSKKNIKNMKYKKNIENDDGSGVDTKKIEKIENIKDMMGIDCPIVAEGDIGGSSDIHLSDLIDFVRKIDIILKCSKDEYIILKKVAVSLLIMECSIQFIIDKKFIPLILSLIFPSLKFSRGFEMLRLDKEKELKPYGVKNEFGEGIKSNIFFSDIWRSCLKNNKVLAEEFLYLSRNTVTFSNDQASCCIIWAIANQVHYGLDAVKIAIKLILNPTLSKVLSILIKSSGNNIQLQFAKLTEAHCLQGMSVYDGDLKDEVIKRTVLSESEGKLVKYNEESLRDAIRSIIIDEMDMSKYKYIDSEDMWNSRWGWCTNGSHTKNLEKHESVWKLSVSERMYRRSCVENINFNPIENFSGRVYVGASFKKEIGKTGRVILSCDTQSYLSFQHLLGPVEDSWKGERVLLNPGLLGNAGTAEQVRSLRSGIGVMLDYDEFDKQHDNTAQSLVIDELCKVISFPEKFRSKLVGSFFNMMVHCNGEQIGLSKYSLMSGHRGTTFINSVLNAAYIRMSIGNRLWYDIDSRHTGDDIVATFKTYYDISYALTQFKKHNLRMNPFKQSVGVLSREFLRVCVNENHSIGYFCRSLGRTVSGNWETVDPMDVEEKMTTWVSNSRSLINRSMCHNISDYFVSSFCSSTGISKKIGRPLLSGVRGLGSGPVFFSTGIWDGYSVVEKDYSKENDSVERNIEILVNNHKFKDYSTSDYLRVVASELEMSVFDKLGISPKPYMLNASYAKNQFVKDLSRRVDKIRLSRSFRHTVRGYILYERYLENKEDKRTIFSVYPLLSFIKGMLKDKDIYNIWRETDLPKSVLENTINLKRGKGNYIEGILSYSDASSIKKIGTLVHVMKNSFV